MGDQIDDLIEEITVDAYGEHEQLWSFRQVFEDEARFPLRGRVVGAEVKVLSVDFDGNERRGLTALCRRGDEVHTVSLLDVTPDAPLPLRTRQLFNAYRRWSGANPLERRRAGSGDTLDVPALRLRRHRLVPSPGPAADGRLGPDREALRRSDPCKLARPYGPSAIQLQPAQASTSRLKRASSMIATRWPRRIRR